MQPSFRKRLAMKMPTKLQYMFTEASLRHRPAMHRRVLTNFTYYLQRKATEQRENSRTVSLDTIITVDAVTSSGFL